MKQLFLIGPQKFNLTDLKNNFVVFFEKFSTYTPARWYSYQCLLLFSQMTETKEKNDFESAKKQRYLLAVIFIPRRIIHN